MTDAYRSERRAAILSLGVSAALMAVKFVAYFVTGSSAIFSDAMESIVNVVAAIFTLGGLVVARWPADRSHPYGHGKVEFLSAAFEGGLIAFAALMIVYQALSAFLVGVRIRALDVGLLITLAAGLANAALGWFLMRTGRKHHSVALVADGRHVMSDFITTAGIVAALGLVMVTGHTWLDPAVAVLLGLNILMTGYQLMREAAGGLMDRVDPALLERIVAALWDARRPGWIDIHRLRAWQSGDRTFVDFHLVVPDDWTVRQLQRQIDSHFYERTALSKDKEAMLSKPTPPDSPPTRAADEIRDPLVLEFLGLKDEYSESDLVEAPIRHLERFLLELGGDFAFVARQRRLRVVLERVQPRPC